MIFCALSKIIPSYLSCLNCIKCLPLDIQQFIMHLFDQLLYSCYKYYFIYHLGTQVMYIFSKVILIVTQKHCFTYHALSPNTLLLSEHTSNIAIMCVSMFMCFWDEWTHIKHCKYVDKHVHELVAWRTHSFDKEPTV